MTLSELSEVYSRFEQVTSVVTTSQQKSCAQSVFVLSIYSRDSFNPGSFPVSRRRVTRFMTCLFFFISRLNLASLMLEKTNVATRPQPTRSTSEFYCQFEDERRFHTRINRGKTTSARISKRLRHGAGTHATIFSNLPDEQPRSVRGMRSYLIPLLHSH